MTSLNFQLTHKPLRLLAATVAVALMAGLAQPGFAQPIGGPPPGGPHGRGAGMGMMAEPHHIERMLDAVNATADQRAQIKQITQAARADMRAQREAGRKLHEDSAALFLQPNVDARAAEVLRQQMLAQHDQASKRTLQMMLDISRVLTPEQRKTLGDRMAQRKALMERHRAERDAMDKAGTR